MLDVRAIQNRGLGYKPQDGRSISSGTVSPQSTQTCGIVTLTPVLQAFIDAKILQLETLINANVQLGEFLSLVDTLRGFRNRGKIEVSSCRETDCISHSEKKAVFYFSTQKIVIFNIGQNLQDYELLHEAMHAQIANKFSGFYSRYVSDQTNVFGLIFKVWNEYRAYRCSELYRNISQNLGIPINHIEDRLKNINHDTYRYNPEAVRIMSTYIRNAITIIRSGTSPDLIGAIERNPIQYFNSL